MPTALLLTDPLHGHTTDLLTRALDRHGVRAVPVFSERFPMHISIRQEVEHSELVVGGEVIDSRDVCGVWLRRMMRCELPPSWPEDVRRAVSSECQTAWEAFLRSLDHAAWVNPWEVERSVSGNKPRQLRVAREVGLQVPDTLITNDPDAVRARVADDPSGWVTKMQTAALVGGHMAFTRRLNAGMLGSLDTLRTCPMIVQRWIPKRRELRVAWVAGRAFCGALDGVIDGRMVDDWRSLPPGATSWRPATLPDEVAHRLDLFMGRLGLVHGGVDLIEDTDGQWWFLEVNSAGEWGMLELELGLPVSDAIAALLARGGSA